MFFVLSTGGCLGAAQCPAKTAHDHMTLTYEFSPHIDGDATTLHVKVTVQGAGSDQFSLRMPGQASKDTVSPWINLKAESAGTKIGAEDEPGGRRVHFTPGRSAVFSYDLQKDWPGPLVDHTQFNPVIFPTYFELFGDNSLARPRLKPSDMVTANFDWRALPADWTLATSFGAGNNAASRCQSFTGMIDNLDQALFAGGDFRLHSFKVGERDVELAIRGTWSFSDDEAAEQLKRPIQLARTFWHDDKFPYFLVTLAPFNEQGNTDGSAYTNAFWFFMGSKDSLSRPRIQKDLLHEAFHEWDPRHMGVMMESQEASDWFQEGVTDYYANPQAYRGGLISASDYADAMNHSLADYSRDRRAPT
jgi:M61 glycyl aminopeptidase